MKNKLITMLCLFMLSSCSEDEKIRVEKITINQTFSMYMRETKTLHAIISPRNTYEKYGKWESSDPNIVKIEYQELITGIRGLVTGIKDGVAEVWLTIDGIKSNICVVTVLYEAKPIKISIKPNLFIINGSTATIEPIFKPYSNIEDKLTWKSSDESVAIINSKGEVTGLKEGTTEITVSHKDNTSNVSLITVLEDKELNIPNSDFKKILLDRYDFNKDGIFSQKDALEVNVLNVDGNYNVTSLEGIQYFHNITQLYCAYNSLTQLDLSKNTELKIVDCRINILQGDLDVSKNINLRELICYGNPLSTIIHKEGQTIYIDCDNYTEIIEVE